MADQDIVVLRLPRGRAQFLGYSISALLQRTYTAIAATPPSSERREDLTKKALMLGLLDDAVRSALLGEDARADRKAAVPAWRELVSAEAADQVDAGRR